MINSLTVQNIALIERLDIELSGGLNILSGETGAGKSIIIDSLNFVLGERADRTLIRHGADHAFVEAVFSGHLTPEVAAYFEEHDIEEDDFLVIKRKMTADGRNECRINGRIVTLATLRGLTELLVDIHGQHEHQSLVRPSNHLGMLDAMGGEALIKKRKRTGELYAAYRALSDELDSLGDEDARARRLDILRFQIDELEKAELREGEEEELSELRLRIRNAEKIVSALRSARDTLSSGAQGGPAAEIKAAAASLHQISAYDSRAEQLIDRLDGAKAEIADIADTLSDMLAENDFDERAAERAEERFDRLRALKRKYGGSVEAAMKFLQEAKAEAETLENASERVEYLEKELKKAGDSLSESAAELSRERAAVAKKFEEDMLRELGDLGMGGTTFKVNIETSLLPGEIGADGGDKAEFLISPNVGEPLRPLARIISGGEMSRFMLAMKNIVAGIDNIGTMVFDEIDTGISGHISAVVAEKMCNISRRRQVIAVTHMPALAAMADSHYLISKSVEDGKTLTRVELLSDDLPEIARLIGGADYSSHALPHAAEMKKRADEFKKEAEKR